MINLDEIEDEINRLEHGNTTYSACEKLSVLYTVRNQLSQGDCPKQAEESYSSYSFAAEPKSEFLKVVADAPLEGVMDILNKHMEVVKAIYPKEYDMVLDMIRGL